MKNLAYKLDETVGDEFFYELDLLFRRSSSPERSLDDFMMMEMNLYRKFMDLTGSEHTARPS